MRSRWTRNQQRLAGTPQMWLVLSFQGKFDPDFFEGLPDPPPQPGQRTAEQRENHKLAVEARAKLREAHRVARRRERGIALSRRERALMKLFDDGSLLSEANELTLKAGNGRLRRLDGSFVDIGGSAGGYARSVLKDWEPPDLTEFERMQ